MIDSSWLLIVVFAVIVGVGLLLINIFIVPQVVGSRWYRGSIALLSLAITCAVLVIGAGATYVALARQAISVVEKIGAWIIVLSVGSALASLGCLVAGLIAATRRRQKW